MSATSTVARAKAMVLLAAALGPRFVFRRFAVEGRFHLPERTRRHGSIARRGINARMAQQDLNNASFGPVFQQMGSEAVAQHMGRDVFGNAGDACGVPADEADRVSLDVLLRPGPRKQPCLGPLHLPVLP